MARTSRIVIVDHPHHTIQRGHNKKTGFASGKINLSPIFAIFATKNTPIKHGVAPFILTLSLAEAKGE